jgi:hypothetical protein
VVQGVLGKGGNVTRLVLVLAITLVALPVAAGDFLDDFVYPDGSFPPEYTWTGDPRGGGYFEVHNEEFTHVDGGHVHYFRDLDICGDGFYLLWVRDTEWVFAWRITPGNPDAGRCLVLYHNDYWYPNAYGFAEFEWWTLGGYPEGQYMWHNGSNINLWTHETGPMTGWQEVVIRDVGTYVEIFINGQLIFFQLTEPIPPGYVGLGCDGPGVMTPAFNVVEYSAFPASPVEQSTWGSVKALFR